MNRLILAAELVERGATRYTPAGLPALDLGLKHDSEVMEDRQPRKLNSPWGRSPPSRDSSPPRATGEDSSST
jgi:hypothetical protein